GLQQPGDRGQAVRHDQHGRAAPDPRLPQAPHQPPGRAAARGGVRGPGAALTGHYGSCARRAAGVSVDGMDIIVVRGRATPEELEAIALAFAQRLTEAEEPERP